MARGKFIVFNEPQSVEVDAEYNAWYSDTHLPQILEHCPSITAASRFKLVSGQENTLPGAPNLPGHLRHRGRRFDGSARRARVRGAGWQRRHERHHPIRTPQYVPGLRAALTIRRQHARIAYIRAQTDFDCR
jgi:hypothetical protein